jgi:hypothetical protein
MFIKIEAQIGLLVGRDQLRKLLEVFDLQIEWELVVCVCVCGVCVWCVCVCGVCVCRTFWSLNRRSCRFVIC